MLRSLHTKLVMIMVLLVLALMMVAGAFLINSVTRFYMKEFYTQMAEVFQEDTAFVRDLTTAAPDELPEKGALQIRQALDANKGALGVDGRNRNYYILDGQTGAYLAGSNDQAALSLTYTPNLLRALQDGQVGSDSDMSAQSMDIAVPISRGEAAYVIYILDNWQSVRDLNGQMFFIIVEALGFGLLISVLLSYLLSKTMTTPIRRLTEGAKQLANRDFAHKIEVESRDEIGILTETFNSMATQLEETISEEENQRRKLAALFLHMTDGVVAFDRSGEIIHANPAAEEMLGRSVSPQGSETYASLFGSVMPFFSLMEENQESPSGELLENNRHLQLFFAPFDQENLGGVLVVIHDITQQMKNEELRREFVANVSHELRTPLTNIRSYSETLAQNPDLPPETQEQFLQVVLSESDRMSHIVSDLLTLSQLDTANGQLQLSVFSFGQLLQDCLTAVRIEVARRGHRVSLLGAEALPDIRADRERIFQVIMNILSNAIKYTPDGGSITLSAGHDRRLVWLEVADNGIGIPEEDRERIFDRFYRVDKARSRQSGGTGLGLSIAREIVLKHQGNLTLLSRSGPGVTVRLELRQEGPEHEE